MSLPDPGLLILDLDETLLHAAAAPLDREPDLRLFDYAVYTRPHLEAFLEYARASWRLAVWTSAGAFYAQGLVSYLGIAPLEFLWARPRCTYCFDELLGAHVWSKNLHKLKRRGYDLARVLMVDDSPEKLRRTYGNLITIKPYQGEAQDSELLALMEYLKTLEEARCVRAIEKRFWRRRFTRG